MHDLLLSTRDNQSTFPALSSASRTFGFSKNAISADGRANTLYTMPSSRLAECPHSRTTGSFCLPTDRSTASVSDASLSFSGRRSRSSLSVARPLFRRDVSTTAFFSVRRLCVFALLLRWRTMATAGLANPSSARSIVSLTMIQNLRHAERQHPIKQPLFFLNTAKLGISLLPLHLSDLDVGPKSDAELGR